MESPSVYRSCLTEKLSNWIELSAGDRQLLAQLEEETIELEAGEMVYSCHGRNDRLHVVSDGWLYSCTTLADGRRQVLQLHFPGDILGPIHLPFQRATHDTVASTRARLCPFPKQGLDPIFERSPRLTALLFTISIIDSTVFMDRIRTLGRMSARERVSHFLLETLCRLRLTQGKELRRFKLPLTQAVIGDATGLTNVYVSKTLTELERDGLIARSRDEVTLLKEQAMRELAEFHDRFSEIDTSWMPVGSASP